MKPKYTTEELQRKIGKISEDLEVIYGEGNGLPLEACQMIEELITAQQQALIEEIEQRLPHPVVLTPWHNSKSMPDHQQQAGRNEVIGQVTETLEAIRKEIV